MIPFHRVDVHILFTGLMNKEDQYLIICIKNICIYLLQSVVLGMLCQVFGTFDQCHGPLDLPAGSVNVARHEFLKEDVRCRCQLEYNRIILKTF